MKNIFLNSKSIIIATHVLYDNGGAQDLRQYALGKKVDRLLFIGHPLQYDQKLSGSGYEYYEKGERFFNKYYKIKQWPDIFCYIFSCLLNLWWTIKFSTGKQWNIYVGCNNLNAAAGVILKKMGYVKKVIYYTIDYNPKRFDNFWLNKIYHWIDAFSVNFADETWNVSPRISRARKHFFGLECEKQKVVPTGVWLSKINRLKSSTDRGQTLVFMGGLIKKQGIQYILYAIPKIAREIDSFRFKIIGEGPFLPELKNIIKELKIEKFVKFLGYIEKVDEAKAILSECALAAAFYEKYDEKRNLTYTYFADPGKVKLYLGCGLPILTTDVYVRAKEIERLKCGQIVKTNPEEIAQAVIGLLKNEKIIGEYRENATAYARKFDWNKIFNKALSNCDDKNRQSI